MSNQQHYHGEDGWSKISDYLNLIKADKVLLITGNAMYQTSGAAQALEPILRHRELTHLICTKPNPCVEDLTHLIEQTGSERAYDAIIAVGGGSVIDLAKLLKAFSLNRSLVDDFFDQQNSESLRPLSVPLIAVPSTAGSGSEATRFAVVYKDGQKQSVEHDDLLPDVSIVIPSLLASVPARVAAASGMDALCQGIESYWSIHSSDASRKLAGEAISIAWSWLVEAVHERTPKSLEQMAKASHLAGRAINMTKTTAPHALSYPMTSYFGITHGHAVGLLTARFLPFNAAVSEHDCLDERGPSWVRDKLDEIAEMLQADSVDSAAEALTTRLGQIGLETDWARLGIKSKQDIKTITDHFDPARAKNNPRAIDKSALEQLIT
ncbi:MAG: phosphonoacetaldehyde reductase [Akkermansiaceae bacterium]